MLTLQHLQRVCRFTPAARLAAVLPHLEASLPEAQVNSPLRLAMYLAQLAHESVEYTRFEENCNYGAESLAALFPHRFPTLAEAAPYARNPERFANKVYSDRLGNGDERSGDGWRYRGRGAIQLTGHANYLACETATGLPLTAQPDLAAMPEHAFRVAAHFWVAKGVNVSADKCDVEGATKRINGGLIGLVERHRYFDRACDALGVLNLYLL